MEKMDFLERGGVMKENSSLNTEIFEDIVEEFKKSGKDGKTEISLPLLVGVYMKRVGVEADEPKVAIINKIAEKLDGLGIDYNRKTAVALLRDAGDQRVIQPSKRRFGRGSTGVEKADPDYDR